MRGNSVDGDERKEGVRITEFACFIQGIPLHASITRAAAACPVLSSGVSFRSAFCRCMHACQKVAGDGKRWGKGMGLRDRKNWSESRAGDEVASDIQASSHSHALLTSSSDCLSFRSLVRGPHTPCLYLSPRFSVLLFTDPALLSSSSSPPSSSLCDARSSPAASLFSPALVCHTRGKRSWKADQVCLCKRRT